MARIWIWRRLWCSTTPLWVHFGFGPNDKPEPSNVEESKWKMCSKKVPVRKGHKCLKTHHLPAILIMTGPSLFYTASVPPKSPPGYRSPQSLTSTTTLLLPAPPHSAPRTRPCLTLQKLWRASPSPGTTKRLWLPSGLLPTPPPSVSCCPAVTEASTSVGPTAGSGAKAETATVALYLRGPTPNRWSRTCPRPSACRPTMAPHTSVTPPVSSRAGRVSTASCDLTSERSLWSPARHRRQATWRMGRRPRPQLW